MVDQELLTAISELLDQKLEEKLEQKLEEKLDQKLDEKLDRKFDEKLKPVYERLDRLETDMKYVRVVQLENDVIPRLGTIEACYLDTSKRYLERAQQLDAVSSDIGVLKSVVRNHSERLSRLSV